MQTSFVEEGTTEEDLNYDFNHNIVLARSLLRNIPNTQDSQRVLRWLQKLDTPTTDKEEMGLRNIVAYYLVVGVQEGKLKYPFNQEPPTGPLLSLRNLLIDKSSEGSVVDEFEDSLEAPPRKKPSSGTNQQHSTPTFEQAKPILYQHSPDGGAFLAAQPIPRCGAFCYMAVVARSSHS